MKLINKVKRYISDDQKGIGNITQNKSNVAVRLHKATLEQKREIVGKLEKNLNVSDYTNEIGSAWYGFIVVNNKTV